MFNIWLFIGDISKYWHDNFLYSINYFFSLEHQLFRESGKAGNLNKLSSTTSKAAQKGLQGENETSCAEPDTPLPTSKPHLMTSVSANEGGMAAHLSCSTSPVAAPSSYSTADDPPRVHLWINKLRGWKNPPHVAIRGIA